MTIIITILGVAVVALLATVVHLLLDLSRETGEVRRLVFSLGRVLHSDLVDIYTKGIPGRTVRREAAKQEAAK